MGSVNHIGIIMESAQDRLKPFGIKIFRFFIAPSSHGGRTLETATAPNPTQLPPTSVHRHQHIKIESIAGYIRYTIWRRECAQHEEIQASTPVKKTSAENHSTNTTQMNTYVTNASQNGYTPRSLTQNPPEYKHPQESTHGHEAPEEKDICMRSVQGTNPRRAWVFSVWGRWVILEV